MVISLICMMQGVGVDIPPLLYLYSRLYLAKDSIWMTEGNSLHLLTVLCFPLSQFAAQRWERRQFNVVCQDTVFFSLPLLDISAMFFCLKIKIMK